MHIILDDDLNNRPTPPRFKRFTTGLDLMIWMRLHPETEIGFITFDNDLGLDWPEGYQVMQQLINEHWSVKHINIHSANVVATKHMTQILQSAMRYQEIPLTPVSNLPLTTYTKQVEEILHD